MKRCPSCLSAFPTNYTHCPRDGSSLAEASDWSEGTVVRGKYQIIGKVGQGGMAAVYKALHVRFKEPRALKVINPELANDASFVRRFEQEAIITRKLQHPNAVRVDDIDEAEDGRPFIVMEYVEGGNLKDVIEREAPLPVERVCSIVKQVAAALDAAHLLGLVHRDIKPANIALVGSADKPGPSSDYVKVLDFGIAKLKEAHLEDSKVHPMTLMTLTGTGMVIGTPAYMSPEQAKGLKGEQLDGRSDIYSLGVVAYQMLTGDLPLKADSTLELLMAHANTPPKPIQEVRPDLKIPDAVAAVVMRCLEKNRDLRPASGQMLIDEIEFAADGRTVLPVNGWAAITHNQIALAQPAELPASPTVARKSGAVYSGWWLWAATGVLISAILGGVWYLHQRRARAEQEKPPAVAASAESKAVAPLASEPLVSAPAEQAPAARPNRPTPGASHEPVPSLKSPEAAPKPPELTSMSEPQVRQPGATDAPVATPKDFAPEPSTPARAAVAASPLPDGARMSEKSPVPAASSDEAQNIFEKAQAALNARKYEEAAVLFGRAARARPGWSDPLAGKAEVDVKLGRFLETIEDCDEALRLNPNDAKVLNFRGFARYSINKIDDAISDYNAAIRINPDYSVAYKNRGNARWALRDKEGAQRDFDTAARLQNTKR